jgi:thimet oligopeptidase
MDPSDLSALQSLATSAVDPVPYGLTAAGITALADEHLGRAMRLLDGIRALAEQPDEALTRDATLGAFDQVSVETALAGGLANLMEETHPEAAVRDAARECRPKLVAFHTEMMLDARLAKVLRRFSECGAGRQLEGTWRRLLEDLLREFRRNGLELPIDQQAQLRELNDAISRLEQEFAMNLSQATETIRVQPEQLRGLPEAFVQHHPPAEDGLVTLSTDYPDYFPVLTYAEDRSVARRLNRLFDCRAADKNVDILKRVLELRQRKASLLGYATWADYQLEPKMAKTPETVRNFLQEAAAAVRAPAREEYAEFQVERMRLLGAADDDPVPVYDRLFLEQKLRSSKYGFDGKRLSEYLPVERVVAGVFDLVSRLFSIELVEVEDAERWHDDVRVLDLLRDEQQVGRLYLDLFPRPNKYKHAAMFEIRPGKRLPDGRYQSPIAALVCNFPKPGAAPALLNLEDVVTFFHELGHGLHHLLTREDLASYAGTNTTHDFVETPSQMFEEWAFQRASLDGFARHYETEERVPDQLFAAMKRSRAFGRALATERQIALATLDFEYHTRPAPFDTDQVMHEVMARTQSFVYQPDTHFQATFGHLMGYDAGYYGYQWALAIARDVLTRFEREGFMNRSTAESWLETVLSRGAGVDESQLVKEFLGRDTNLRAYAAYLGGA